MKTQRLTHAVVAGIAAAFIFGCTSSSKSGSEAELNRTSEVSAAPQQTKTSVSTRSEGKAEKIKPPATPPKQQRQTRKRTTKPIKWTDSLTWKTWEEARAHSADTGKPIMLMVYAHWCPRCRELGPVFQSQAIIDAAQSVILVRQDQDLKPDWLNQYAEFGGYVPRILFFGPDGQVRRDITSGHPRFPYFYTPRGQAALVESMKKIAEK